MINSFFISSRSFSTLVLITKRITLTLTSTAHAINDGNTILLPVIYAYMASTFGLSTIMIGILGGVFWGVSALAAPVVSYLADKSHNSIRIMGLGILIWGFGLDIFGVSIIYFNANLVIIFASVIITGFAFAFYHPLGGTAVSQMYGGNAGAALGLNGSMGSVGRALYPSLIIILFEFLGSTNNSMGLAIFIISLITLFNAIPSLLSRPEIDYGEKAKKKEEEMDPKVKRSLYVVIALLTIITVFRSVFTQGVTQFLPTLLTLDLGYQYNTNLGFILTVTLAPPILGQPLFGYLSDMFDRRLLFGISNIGSAISFYLFLVYPNIIWLISYGFFTYSLFPLMLSLIGDLVPKGNSNLASGIVWGIGSSGGGAIGPVIVGFLAGVIGLSTSLLAVTVLGFLSGLLVYFIPKSEKRSKTPLFR